uniref:Protein TIC 20 n=1 Tax=Phaseolus vulgaris TaxID=3885 RepID=V7AU26_PHAVU|nr:hypothetical protein PHAVU_010G151100g [Phaseolus vulgaris]ESW07696.1 hypothetical protein PHAVU_010G151100g [Phaseolus vulgaris]
MIQNGCIVSQGCAPVNSRSRNHVLPTCSIIRCASRMSANVAASKIRSFSRHNLECKSSFPRGMTFSNVFAAPSLRLSEGQNLLFRSFPALPQLRKSNMVPRASSKDVPTSFRYPPMTKKPQWWWRSLACLPYLMPLHRHGCMLRQHIIFTHFWNALNSTRTLFLWQLGACLAGFSWHTFLLRILEL